MKILNAHKSPRRFQILNLFLLVGLSACSDLGPEFQSLGSQVLGHTGMSSSQINTTMSVGKNLATVKTGLTEEEEYYLGRGVAAMVFSKYKPLNNSALNSYVNKVGRVVASVSERPEAFNGYHFLVLDSSEINAFAAPGGFVFITKGLLKLAPDEDALAGILAHEVSHVVLGHGVKAITQASLTQAFMVIGKEAADTYSPGDLKILTSTFGDSVSNVFETVLGKGYSRSQEYDSDAMAVKLAKEAGYNPNGLANTLAALEKQKGEAGWYSTHPSATDRLEEIEDDSKPSSEMTPAEAVRKKRFEQAVGHLS